MFKSITKKIRTLRMRYTAVLFIPLLVISCAVESPQLVWFKGNLHTHSYWSDGNDYPEMIMQWYKEHGYDFVALSDHNILAEGDKWINVKKGTPHEETFKEYLEEYGEEWVEYKEQENAYRVKLKTLNKYRTHFEEPSIFEIIKSEEITDGFENKPIHVNATNVQQLIKPQGGNSVAEVMQNNIDAVLAQRDSTGESMFPHINHPNFGWSVTAEDLKQLEGERFFVVYNGHPQVHNYGDSLRSGTEQMWDEVITHYIRKGKPVIYGIAVDDAHNYHQFDSTKANPGRGWIQVKSQSLTPDSLITAMEQGDFYATSGVRIKDIKFDGHTLSIEIDVEEGISYKTEFIGTWSGANKAILFDTQEGSSVSYRLTSNELYVRAKVISDKMKQNPYKKGEFEVAWIQPITPKNK